MKAILVFLGCGLLVSTSVMSLLLWQTHNRATALEVTSNQLRVELQLPSRPAIPSPVGTGAKSGSPWGSVFVPP